MCVFFLDLGPNFWENPHISIFTCDVLYISKEYKASTVRARTKTKTVLETL